LGAIGRTRLCKKEAVPATVPDDDQRPVAGKVRGVQFFGIGLTTGLANIHLFFYQGRLLWQRRAGTWFLTTNDAVATGTEANGLPVTLAP